MWEWVGVEDRRSFGVIKRRRYHHYTMCSMCGLFVNVAAWRVGKCAVGCKLSLSSLSFQTRAQAQGHSQPRRRATRHVPVRRFASGSATKSKRGWTQGSVSQRPREDKV